MSTVPRPIAVEARGHAKPNFASRRLLVVIIALSAGLAVFTRLTAPYWARSVPALEPTLHLRVTFPEARAGETQPLIATGKTGDGDFLTVLYRDAGMAVLGYDHWGAGGPSSSSFSVRPGVPHDLVVEMPSLTGIAGQGGPDQGRLRVVLDGREVLNTNVPFNHRLTGQLYFGFNPLGGTPARFFGGRIARVSGHSISGDYRSYFTSGERARRLMQDHPYRVALALLAGALAAAAIFGLGNSRWIAPSIDRLLRRHARHAMATVLISASATGYLAAVTFGTFDLWAPEGVGVFYDYQADALLHGRLDVPDKAIRDEAFIVDGKFYGYFGPTPAILRLPVILFHPPYGRLTKIYMLADFVGGLIAAYLILRDTTKRLRGPGAEPSGWATFVTLGGAGLGSTLFFLGARPMMYHEAIACGAVFALWSCWCTLRQLETPARRWWIGALVCGVLSVNARPTVGFFALTLLGLVAVYQFLRAIDPNGDSPVPSRVAWRRGKAFGLALLCVAGELTLNGVAYLKFKTFDSAPYELSRPYIVDPNRYAKVGRQKIHVENIPWGFYSYFVRRNFEISPNFPYLSVGSRDPGLSFPRAKIDLPDYLVPVPYAMPGLFAVATLGSVLAFVVNRRTRLALGLVWLAAVPQALLLFAFIAIAQRYSGDLCPALICSATIAVAAIDRLSGWPWRIVRLSFLALTAAGIVVSALLVFDYQGRWGPSMPDEIHHRYQEAGESIDDLVRSLW